MIWLSGNRFSYNAKNYHAIWINILREMLFGQEKSWTKIDIHQNDVMNEMVKIHQQFSVEICYARISQEDSGLNESTTIISLNESWNNVCVCVRVYFFRAVLLPL